MAKILVVDDDLDVRNLVAMVLRDTGHDVESSVDGRDGLGKIAALEPHLVILDLMMPEIDGWGFLAALRQRPTAPLVILLSAFANDGETRRRAVEAGVWDCLAKPFGLPELVVTCNNALRALGGKA